MKLALLFAGSSPVVIVTSYPSLTAPSLLEKLEPKGITKFIADEVPVTLAHERYGGHFRVAMRDLHETDDLRVLYFDVARAFRLFHLKELGAPIMVEGGATV